MALENGLNNKVTETGIEASCVGIGSGLVFVCTVQKKRTHYVKESGQWSVVSNEQLAKPSFI